MRNATSIESAFVPNHVAFSPIGSHVQSVVTTPVWPCRFAPPREDREHRRHERQCASGRTDDRVRGGERNLVACVRVRTRGDGVAGIVREAVSPGLLGVRMVPGTFRRVVVSGAVRPFGAFFPPSFEWEAM